MAGLMDFFKTPEGQGLLAAGFGAAAGARPGQPWNTLGRGGMAGLMGFANAQDRELQTAERAEAQKDRDFNRQYRQVQTESLNADLAKKRGEQEWRAGLPAAAAQVQPTYGAGDEGPTMKPGDPNALVNYAMQPNSPFADEVLKARLVTKPQEAFTLGEGQVRYSPDGKIVAQGAPKVDAAPTNVREYEYARGQGYKGTFEQFQLDQKRAGAASTRVTVDAAPKAFWNDFGKQASDTLFKERESATAASGVLNSVNQIKQAVTGGSYQGAGAELKLGAAKALGALGMPYDQATVANTELFNAQANQFVLSSIKQLGANPSNADREFIEKTVPRLSTDPAALPALLNYIEGKARSQVRGFNTKIKGVQSQSNGMSIPMDLGVPEPELMQLNTSPGAGWSATKKN